MSGRSKERSGAFTLVELLVVIAIVTVLVGLIVPAVQKVRESASRSRCAQQMRQLGLGLTHHHDVYGVYPANGGWDGKQTIPSVSGAAVVVSTTDLRSGRTYRFGVGAPGKAPAYQPGSWLYAILPFLEQDAMYREREWRVAVAGYVCPSRRSALAFAVVERDAYGAYVTGGWAWAKTDYAGNGQIFPLLAAGGARCLSTANLTDGTSNTVLVGEKAVDPLVQTPESWFWDESFFVGGSRGTTRTGFAILRDKPGNKFKQNWGSAHAAGAHFLFADGGVRPLAYGTPRDTVAALMSPAGGEVVDGP